MMARILRFTTLGLLLAAFAWVGYCVVHGRPGVAAFGAVLLLLGHALVVGFEFGLAWHANRADPAPPSGRWLVAWWGEVLKLPQVFCWRQPFFADDEPDRLPDGAVGRVGVVFIHGFVCNRGLWTPWLKRLRELDVPFVAINLEPAFGSIDNHAASIDRAVRRVAAATSLPPLVVAHSMGGLAVRAWLSAFDADPRVRHVITIGAPHHGTQLATCAFTRNARQMRRNTAWQHALAAQETPQRLARFTCFYSRCDNVVMPASSATLPGADNRHLPGVAHIGMAHDDRVFSEVLRRVGA